MRTTRVYQDQALEIGQTLALDETASRHLLRVLRLKVGDRIRLFNGDGQEFGARLAAATGKVCQVAVDELISIEPEAELRLHLALAISKGERMDFAIQKAVELGVQTITPLFSRRSVVKLSGERLRQKHRHWRGVAISACEQSGRARLAEVAEPVELTTWLAADHGMLLILAPNAARPLTALEPPGHGRLAVLVGPEGGLADDEIELAEHMGATPVRLGPRVLRTETAPLAALAAMQALWGDFQR